jgi:hypothetical protein
VGVVIHRLASELKTQSVTDKRRQTAKNQLSVIKEPGENFVRQLLLDDHLSSIQIRTWHSEGILTVVHNHTTFLRHEVNGDRWSIDPAWREILTEMLLPADSVFKRQTRKIWEWACSQSRGLRRIAKAMKDTHKY